jgi:hypothetical protein
LQAIAIHASCLTCARAVLLALQVSLKVPMIGHATTPRLEGLKSPWVESALAPPTIGAGGGDGAGACAGAADDGTDTNGARKRVRTTE